MKTITEQKNHHAKSTMILILMPIFILWVYGYSSDCEYSNSDSEHKNHHSFSHHHHSNEFGLSMGFAFIQPESETAFAAHLHFMKRLGNTGIWKYFGLGLGVETVFADSTHYNIMTSFLFFPYSGFKIELSPGILFLNENGDTEKRISMHIELVYEFELGFMELGPVLGYSMAGEDQHFMIGIHLSKGF